MSCDLDNCGFGSCNRNTENRSVCVCFEGWSQSLEDTSLDTLPCDTNLTILQILYSFGGTLSLLGLLGHFWILKSWKQVLRLSPTLWTMLMIVLYSFPRAVHVDQILYGEDIFFTMAYNFGVLGSQISGQIMYLNFIYYVLKRFPFLEGLAKQRLRVINFGCFITTLFALIAIISGVLTAFVVDPETARNLFTVFVSVLLVNSIFSITSSPCLLGFFIREITQMINGQKLTVDLDVQYKIKLRRLLPLLRKTMYVKLGFDSFTTPFYILTLNPYIGFGPWRYILPAFNLIWSVAVIIAVRQQLIIAFNKQKKFAKIVEINHLLE